MANGGGKSGVRRRGGIGGKAAEYTAGRGAYGNEKAEHTVMEKRDI